MAKRTFQDLYKEFMSNPHRTPMPGKTKHESAMEAAHKQLLQSYNNDMALSLMPKEIEDQYLEKRRLTQQNELISNITKEDISSISEKIAKQFVKEESEQLKIRSLKEEEKAVNDYSERADISSKEGDEQSAELFTHLAEDEKNHIKELIADLVKQIAGAASAKERAKSKGLVPQSGDENHPGRWVKPGNQAKKKPKQAKKPMKPGKTGTPGTTNKVQAKNTPTKKSY